MQNLPGQPALCTQYQQGERKGAVIVMVAVLMVVLLGCVALAVDIGYLYVARAELQRAADAAALAGAQALARASDTPVGEHLYLKYIYNQEELVFLLIQMNLKRCLYHPNQHHQKLQTSL